MMFKPTRMGLINFWLYDDEVFDFYDGKLLLRGKNGSGKSVTMQSFIPLILDGNKSPKRLDTFGSTDKHIEYYLLGENNEKDDSTGYLYMEFYNSSEDRYITIGMGLRARRGKPTDFFGFILKDGRRVGKDFFLYKTKDGFTKTPLTRLELKAALGVQNNLVETAKEYKKLVNDNLFKFKNIETFDEFINIILQIRSPKLSKEYKPTQLMEVLNEVLPPLADETLRPLSDTIENLNETKEKMDELKEKINILTNFTKVFKNYNEAVLLAKASNYYKEYQTVEKIKSDILEKETHISEIKNNIDLLKEEQSSLEDEYNYAKEEREHLNNTDLEEKSRRKLELEEEIKVFTERLTKEEEVISNLKQKMSEISSIIEDNEDSITLLDKEITDTITTLSDLGEEISFSELQDLIPFIKEMSQVKFIIEKINFKKEEIDKTKELLLKKGKLLEEQNVKSNEYESLKEDYNEKEKIRDNLYEELDSELELFFMSLRNLSVNNKYLILLEEDIKEIANYLDEYTSVGYLDAKNKYEEIYKIKYSDLVEKLSIKKTELLQDKDNLSKEELILKELLETEEIKLEEDDLTKDTISFLDKENIPYASLYQVVEFKDDISDDVKDKLEEVLYSSGILNTKIFRSSDLSKIKNMNISYFKPSSKKKNNLTKYLKAYPNEYFDSDFITKVLESISTDTNDLISVNENSYSFDFIKGNISTNYKSKYIGILKRKEEHLLLIKNQEEKINILKDIIKSKEEEIKTIENALNTLNYERELFPSNKILDNISSKIKEIDLELDFINNKEKVIEEEIRNYQKQIEEVVKELEKYRRDLPLNISTYEKASVVIREILDTTKDLISLYEKLNQRCEILATNKERLDDLTINHDEVYASIANLVSDKKKREIELDTILKILNTKEYLELSKKIEKIVKTIEEYPVKSSSLSKRLGILEQSLTNEEVLLKEIEQNNKEENIILEILSNILKEELDLGYVTKELTVEPKVIKAFLKNNSTKDKDLKDVTMNYYRSFNEYRQDLLEYNIQDVVLFNERENLINHYSDKVSDKTRVINIYNDAKRQDVLTSYQGKKLNIYELANALSESYEADKIYLNEQDRHLFEDILLRTIGTKIKDKIIEAKDWVKNINNIMEIKQQNSNLSFYLDWKPKSGETLEEMDTKDLVEIFMMPTSSLREEDTNRLIKHFRSKIKREEESMFTNKITYFDMIFNILDYRNWFTFKLFYKKDGNQKRELTDKIFSVFSGGEKAKTMYVPLFASIYAKLDSADSSSPRLIALDEAFAGVDEVNIEEMFAILSSFDLDYILTSQALWCDYKEIKDISICELIKPKYADAVSIKRYRWNGLVRESVE